MFVIIWCDYLFARVNTFHLMVCGAGAPYSTHICTSLTCLPNGSQNITKWDCVRVCVCVCVCGAVSSNTKNAIKYLNIDILKGLTNQH